MAREMVEPSEALDHIVETGIRPKWDVLVAICSELLAPHRDPDLIEHAAASVIGQCLLFKQSSAVIERLFDRKGYSSAELDNIARRISMFSLHALRGLRAERPDSVPEAPHEPRRARMLVGDRARYIGILIGLTSPRC